MTDIVERLAATGAERQRTTAHDNPDHYLHVVAKISQSDGKLMLEAAAEIERLRAALERARTVLANMALEKEPSAPWINRWPIHHEPLRADARNLLPVIDAALAGGQHE